MTHAVRSWLVAGLALLLVAPLAADEGWVIKRLVIRLDIQPDGTLVANEAFDVDFRNLSKHGIFRDVTYRFSYDETQAREYRLDLVGVTSADGRPHRVQTSTNGADWRLRIGDPDRTITGKQTYRIGYRVRHALNGFADHDELYWNATGTWPVRIESAAVIVHAPAAAIERVACYQGPRESREPCRSRFTGDEATFAATRVLAEGEQVTIVAGLRKGAVAEPRPLLFPKVQSRAPLDSPAETAAAFFHLTPMLVGVSTAGLLASVGGVGLLWWRIGRDRRFVSMHYLSQTSDEERVPLFGARPIAVEFEPPERLRPGQMGLLIDERADTLDVTATIVDLAVRGYLTITELPDKGWFRKKDWQLDRLKPADAHLNEYERIVLQGLFDAGPQRQLSELKNHFYQDLARAKTALYQDAIARGWFPRSPRAMRIVFVVVGLLLAIVGIGLTLLLGAAWGAGVIGLPVVAGGLLLVFVARIMPRRTAAGRELMRRTLGFARYIRTGETRQQAFAERANIFTQYLPYAIAFKCVDKWARAFKDIDLQVATAAWYSGATAFDAHSFSSDLGSFSDSVSSAMASTPGGSGDSGFGGGGSSGGGGGGGGGGSW